MNSGAKYFELLQKFWCCQKFLKMIARFKKRLESHGASAEGNPSGGNIYRGLYNITLKSCGAAQKKAPDLSLITRWSMESVSQRCGFMFMDSLVADLGQ